MRRLHSLTLVAIAFCVAGCGSRVAGAPPQEAVASRIAVSERSAATTPLKHILIIIHENRSFDDLFATFPGADGATSGKTSNGKTVELRRSHLAGTLDLGHSWQASREDYDGGKMDGFNLENGGKAGTSPYEYVNPSEIKPYWEIAKRYVLADHMFSTQGSGSFTAHQDLIRGGTAISGSESLIDFPSHQPWGCDSPPGTTTTLLTVKQQYEPGAGPFPCLKYRTLRDLLDAKSVSWTYYSPRVKGSTGAVWNAFDVIRAVRYGSEWGSNVTMTDQRIFSDISSHHLAAVSWFVPDLANSDHPGYHAATGPSAVADIVNDIGESSYWSSTAIVIVWDDWGGFYDHVPPAFHDNYGGLGFRVPMLVISPYTRRGYIDHTQYEFGSILKFVEDN